MMKGVSPGSHFVGSLNLLFVDPILQVLPKNNLSSASYVYDIFNGSPLCFIREALKKDEFQLGNCPKRWEGVNLKFFF